MVKVMYIPRQSWGFTRRHQKCSKYSLHASATYSMISREIMLFSGDLPLTSYLHFMTCREYNRYIFVLVAIFTSCRDIVQQLAHTSMYIHRRVKRVTQSCRSSLSTEKQFSREGNVDYYVVGGPPLGFNSAGSSNPWPSPSGKWEVTILPTSFNKLV